LDGSSPRYFAAAAAWDDRVIEASLGAGAAAAAAEGARRGEKEGSSARVGEGDDDSPLPPPLPSKAGKACPFEDERRTLPLDATLL
jgi:hypothetical protein